MNETLKVFTIKDIDLFRDDENVDFAIAEVYFISDGNNAQNCPISTETLKRDANTALGKPLVAKYHKERGDIGSHELEEVIVGWIPESSIIEFKEKDGKLFAVAKAVVSKIYATEVYQLFLNSNERAVSCEFSAHQPNADYMGEGEIEGFIIRGITLLGKSVRPCVDGADIKIIKFSEKDADEFYMSSTSTNVLKSFAEERKIKLDIKKHKNKKNASINKEFEVIGDKDKEGKMEEKTFAINIENLWSLIYSKLEKDYPDREYGSIYRIDGIYKEDDKMFAIVHKKDESTLYKININTEDDNVALDVSFIEVESAFLEKGTIMTFEKEGESKYKTFEKDENEIIMEDTKKVEELENEDKKTPEVEEKEKKFSLNAYADCGATIAFLEHETEQNKALAEKVMKEMSAEDIVKTVIEFAKEVEELKKFKVEVEDKEKQKKFSSIMASVRGDLDEKTFSDLYKEGENVSLIDMSGFENKVKAFAYEATKKKTVEKTITTEFKFAVDSGLNKLNDDGDVFAKIANK